MAHTLLSHGQVEFLRVPDGNESDEGEYEVLESTKLELDDKSTLQNQMYVAYSHWKDFVPRRFRKSTF